LNIIFVKADDNRTNRKKRIPAYAGRRFGLLSPGSPEITGGSNNHHETRDDEAELPDRPDSGKNSRPGISGTESQFAACKIISQPRKDNTAYNAEQRTLEHRVYELFEIVSLGHVNLNALLLPLRPSAYIILIRVFLHRKIATVKKGGLMPISANMFLMILSGVLVGIGASFTGLGGGFLMVPLLLFLGFSAQKAVGTSFLAILVISVSALLAHNKLSNVDYRVGILLGIGGIAGAQIGARLVEHVPTDSFKKIFAFVLVGLASYLFLKK
jgi:hypothetical protein